ncbi:MAG: hypothetical protein ACREQD_14610, partial [Candidatus Binataceae bacterium]
MKLSEILAAGGELLGVGGAIVTLVLQDVDLARDGAAVRREAEYLARRGLVEIGEDGLDGDWWGRLSGAGRRLLGEGVARAAGAAQPR